MNNMTLIIATYNRLNSLVKSLNTVFDSSVIPSEIIIVDQSIDAENNAVILSDFFFNKNYDKAKIITLSEPSSTHARNVGIINATKNIIVFMDDDVDVEVDTFKHVQSIMYDENVALLGGIDKLAKPNKKFFPAFFGLINLRKKNEGHIVKSFFGRYPSVVNKEVSTEWAMGYFFAIKKNLAESWNVFFDENLGQYAYSEDADFSFTYFKNAEKANLKCILSPQVIVSHLCSKEWRTSSKRQNYVFVFNRYYLIQKHFNTMSAKFLFWWANIGFLLKKVIQKDNPKDFLYAMFYCVKYKNDIKRGELHRELYE